MRIPQTLQTNSTPGAILANALMAAAGLFFNGFGVYLTIQANIGAGPWDVLSLGVSRTLGILYGTASISISFTILLIDVLLREPIGIAMFIDAVTVGKAVDLFNRMGVVTPCASPLIGIPVMLLGLVIMAYTQFVYMKAALGCGPRDTLLVGLAKRAGRIPIGAVSIAILALATFAGWLLGGPVGIGTLICAFCTGPIMQAAFQSVRFDATEIRHQHLGESARVLFGKQPKQSSHRDA